jgi:hypothetical protein
MLLAKGADKEGEGKRGITPLMFAAHNGHKDVVALLLKHGANIEAKHENGWTPLMIAANAGREDVVELLINNGVDIEAKQKDGATALMLAAEPQAGHEDVVKLLLTKFGLNSETFHREREELQATSSRLQQWIWARKDSTIESEKEWLKRAKNIEKMVEEKYKNLSSKQESVNMKKPGSSAGSQKRQSKPTQQWRLKAFYEQNGIHPLAPKESNHGGPVKGAASVKTYQNPSLTPARGI